MAVVEGFQRAGVLGGDGGEECGVVAAEVGGGWLCAASEVSVHILSIALWG
ncbi:hypothetical protein [Sphaerisporangium album]|uniref:hypothetical protein n=1 Tax=Sphaerisporangium album TaxID=509200 RepID=UPI0015F0C16A|nr:hypothetical protein [Sphaerisporangium album]